MERRAATEAEINEARAMYADASGDDVCIDDDARVSEAEDAIWVQAWVRLAR